MNFRTSAEKTSLYVNRLIVREFEWDPLKLSNQKKQMQELISQEREQWVILLIDFTITIRKS